MKSEKPVHGVGTKLGDGEAVKALTCPQCGASVDPDRRTQRQLCPYCGSVLIFK